MFLDSFKTVKKKFDNLDKSVLVVTSIGVSSDARLCQLRGISWTTLPDLASALLNGQTTNGKRSTVKMLPGSVLLGSGPVPGLLGWPYPE